MATGTEPAALKPFVCAECGRRLRSERGLADHCFTKHDGPKPEASAKPTKWRAFLDEVRDTGESILYLPVLFSMLVGMMVVLTIPWIVLSYVVMVAAWLLGSGELHPFPEWLLIPGDSCWPGTPPC